MGGAWRGGFQLSEDIAVYICRGWTNLPINNLIIDAVLMRWVLKLIRNFKGFFISTELRPALWSHWRLLISWISGEHSYFHRSRGRLTHTNKRYNFKGRQCDHKAGRSSVEMKKHLDNLINFNVPQIKTASMVKSATSSRAEGMRMAPGRGRGHLCWWPLIFKKNFLISVLSDLSALMTN